MVFKIVSPILSLFTGMKNSADALGSVLGKIVGIWASFKIGGFVLKSFGKAFPSLVYNVDNLYTECT